MRPPIITIHVPYERVLRAVGAHLDQREARLVVLIEVPEGVTVRYCLQGSEVGPETVTFTYASLVSATYEAHQRRNRGTLLRSQARDQAGAYEDVLRSLGFFLEHNQASTILLAERYEILYLYLHQQLSPGSARSRAPLVLSVDEVDRRRLIADAYARRRDA